eukprot:4334377-Pyramimonas_sp.AAC.1
MRIRMRMRMNLVWAILGLSLPPVRQFWESLRAFLGRLGALLRRLGVLLGGLRAALAVITVGV